MRLPKFGDPHNLSSPPSERRIIVQEIPERPSLRDGEGSARVGDEIPIWVARGDLVTIDLLLTFLTPMLSHLTFPELI